MSRVGGAVLLLALTLTGCGTPVAGRDASGGAADGSPGWTVTVYYTAVEELHSGAPIPVTGCPGLDCARGHADLGRYPADFVAAVHDEGTGRITSGGHAGRYLNWSSDVGYWLDDVPRDSHGRTLEPYRSAAADSVPDGTEVRLRDCGRLDDDGSPVLAGLCARLRDARWEIRDEFTPGLGGARHLDLYLGEETGPDFTASPAYLTLTGATVRLG